jgi:hypothetical protein
LLPLALLVLLPCIVEISVHGKLLCGMIIHGRTANRVYTVDFVMKMGFDTFCEQSRDGAAIA